MTLKTSKKSLSIAVGTALGVSLALSPMAFADSSNPFGATELSGGYMQLADGHAGEGKCGGDKAANEAVCGIYKVGSAHQDNSKVKDGVCGGHAPVEMLCGDPR